MNSKDGSAGPIPNKGGIRYEQHTGGVPTQHAGHLYVYKTVQQPYTADTAARSTAMHDVSAMLMMHHVKQGYREQARFEHTHPV
jgi:hypothetical protein